MFLYYSRAVDPTITQALNEIGSEQAEPTKKTKMKVLQFFDYIARNPKATIRYHRSGMILNIHSNASYLLVKNGRSRAAGHFFSWLLAL